MSNSDYISREAMLERLRSSSKVWDHPASGENMRYEDIEELIMKCPPVFSNEQRGPVEILHDLDMLLQGFNAAMDAQVGMEIRLHKHVAMEVLTQALVDVQNALRALKVEGKG